MNSARYLEDVQPGDSFESGAATMVEVEMIEFAARFDPQPMHTDPVAAMSGPFGGLIASGWHTAAVVMRLLNEARPLGDTPLIGMSVDFIRWPLPVRAGDVLRAKVEVLAMRVSRTRPSHGILKLRVITRNQRGETVMVQEPNCWVPRRPPEP
ncbi:MAG TPA: MaoC family dehydratase [Bryobacteraceae bacterium]|nr:MaoC family dehydratase [Bryobacteraceae bacterium]